MRPSVCVRPPNNARTHSKKQLKQIASSIERFGFVNPVLISDDFEIIAGHGRVEAAKILGLKEVPTVRLSNLSPAERRAYVIADNRLAELAGWDRELLATELKGLLELAIRRHRIDRVFARRDRPHAGRGSRKEDRANPDPRTNFRRTACRARPFQGRAICGSLGRTASCVATAIRSSCDVIVRRWQQYTGKAARLEGSDLTFADVEATRLAGQSASTAAEPGE